VEAPGFLFILLASSEGSLEGSAGAPPLRRRDKSALQSWASALGRSPPVVAQDAAPVEKIAFGASIVSALLGLLILNWLFFRAKR
jgi:hypothetical protein